jgi:hypothetical protein
MLLPSTWRDLTKSILDPSKDELKEACRQVCLPFWRFGVSGWDRAKLLHGRHDVKVL